MAKNFQRPSFHGPLVDITDSRRIVLEAADIPLLPFNLTDLEKAIKGNLKVLERDYTSLLQKGNVTLKHLAREVETFSKNVDAFEKRKAIGTDFNNFAQLRMLNDQMMSLERAFIWPNGLPGRVLPRQLLFAPQMHNVYGSATFPGMTDALFDREN